MPFPSQIGRHINDLPTPCLVVGLHQVQSNCQRMQEKASRMGVQLRAQTKTHKTVEGVVYISKRVWKVWGLSIEESVQNNI